MGSSSAPSVSSNTMYDPNGMIQGGSMSYNGASLNMQNPAQFSADQLNPSAGKYVDNLSNLYTQFQNSAAGSAFNPNFYNQMQQQQQAGITNTMGNEYARMGLSGSSAEMGGIAQAVNQNQMSWLNRQQSDQMHAMQGMEGLDQTMMHDVMGLQGQYGDFESAYNQSIASLLGMQQQRQMGNDANTAGMWEAGMGAAGSGAGMAARSGGGG